MWFTFPGNTFETRAAHPDLTGEPGNKYELRDERDLPPGASGAERNRLRARPWITTLADVTATDWEHR